MGSVRVARHAGTTHAASDGDDDHDERRPERERIARAHLVQEVAQQPRQLQRSDQPQHDAGRRQREPLRTPGAADPIGPAPSAIRSASSRVFCDTVAAITP